ncbi:hypothetical protein D3C78_1627920 [compost metagenome]
MQRTTGDIRHLHAQRQRPSVGTAGVTRQPGQGQVVDVMTGAVLVGARLAIAGDRHINQSRIDRLQGFVTQAQTLHDTGAELLEHNVVVLQQRPDHLQRLRLFEVQGEAALVAIEIGMTG